MTPLFVDESKSKGYTMVAVEVDPVSATALRKSVRSLVMPGQRRIHFTSEGDSRRRTILSELADLGMQAHVFHCDTKSERIGRQVCLRGIVELAAQNAHRRIVIERDESIERSDRRLLFQEVRRLGLGDELSYCLEKANNEPLLWVADAIAWSYAKGGDWGRRVKPLIVGVHQLQG